MEPSKIWNKDSIAESVKEFVNIMSAKGSFSSTSVWNKTQKKKCLTFLTYLCKLGEAFLSFKLFKVLLLTMSILCNLLIFINLLFIVTVSGWLGDLNHCILGGLPCVEHCPEETVMYILENELSLRLNIPYYTIGLITNHYL